MLKESLPQTELDHHEVVLLIQGDQQRCGSCIEGKLENSFS